MACDEQIGKRFGRLVVVAPARDYITPSTGDRRRRWLCLCDCGKEKTIHESSLSRGYTKSCGCLNRELVLERNALHGAASRENRTPEFVVWVNMRQRCSNQTRPDWHNYGGRGIVVCPHWQESFEAFLSDMGERPSPQHSIDRINNDGSYACPKCCPPTGNCRWATREVQTSNRRLSGRTPGAPAL